MVNVFRLGSNGRYSHAAQIIPKAGENPNFGGFATSGRRVLIGLGGGNGPVSYLELPATLPTPPAVIQSTFNADAAGWTGISGQFATAPAQTGSGNPGRVYRQSSITGEAIATLNNSDWTDQAIEADIRPTQFSSNDRWVGLATRFTDAANFYYVAVRSSGKVLLRRKVNGAFNTLASAPLQVAINTDYRLRLEAAGDRLRVFVNGVKVLEAHDAALSHGRAALITYMAKADYDNVVVTPSPSTTIYADRFYQLQQRSTGTKHPRARGSRRYSTTWVVAIHLGCDRPPWPEMRASPPEFRRTMTRWCSSPPFRAALQRTKTAGLA